MKIGAVAGWARTGTEHGIILTVQIATNSADFSTRTFEKVELVLNDRQLRSLARDMARAAEERGLTLFAKRPWWKVWTGNPA